jgi:hypothetical protein
MSFGVCLRVSAQICKMENVIKNKIPARTALDVFGGRRSPEKKENRVCE